MIIIILILLLTGVLGGLTAGLLGLGGGIIFAPVLLILYQYYGLPEPVLWTVGTSLLCTFVASASSAFKHYQMDNLFLREGFLVGMFGVAGTFVGRFIATSPYYSEREFIIFFSLLLLYSVYHFLKKKKHSHVEAGREVRLMRWHHAMLVGISSGLLATLAGVGGGLILVPGLTIFLSFGYRKVVSISSTAVVLITLSGWLQLALLTSGSPGLSGLQTGYVDFGVALPLIAGGVFGARYGVRLLNVVRFRTVEIIFAVILLLMIGRLLYGL